MSALSSYACCGDATSCVIGEISVWRHLPSKNKHRSLITEIIEPRDLTRKCLILQGFIVLFGFLRVHRCYFRRMSDWHAWTFFTIGINPRWSLFLQKITLIGSYLGVFLHFCLILKHFWSCWIFFIEAEVKKQIHIKVKVLSNVNIMDILTPPPPPRQEV